MTRSVSAGYSTHLKQRRTLLSVAVGAALAIGGGIIGEFWKEGRANQREVRLLRAELIAIVELCEVALGSREDLSVSHYLPQWRSFATQGAAMNRAWLRALSQRIVTSQVLKTYLMASTMVRHFEEFAADETVFQKDNDKEGYYRCVARHRPLVVEFITLLRREAEESIELLTPIANRRLVL